MKKVFVLALAVLLLAGCGKNNKTNEDKLSCSKTNTIEEKEAVTVVDIDVKDDIVTNATATITYETEETANEMCEIYKIATESDDNLECKGKNITIKDYQKAISNDKLSKDEVLDYFKEREYTCK